MGPLGVAELPTECAVMHPSCSCGYRTGSWCDTIRYDGDALTYAAKQTSGEPLPKWIQFDRISRTFTFKPPKEHDAALDIEISATDFEGLSATNLLKVSFYNPETD